MSRTASMMGSYFFFQAEDGIRDLTVTGVQTCALPISPPAFLAGTGSAGAGVPPARRSAALDSRPTAPSGRIADRKSTRLNSSHSQISYAVFCLKKKKKTRHTTAHKYQVNHSRQYTVYC